VGLDGALADAEDARDLLDRLPFRDELEDLALPRREHCARTWPGNATRRERQVQCRCEAGLDLVKAPRHGPHSCDELVRRARRRATTRPWHTLVESAGGGVTTRLASPRLLDVRDLHPGDHVCCIYETEEQHRELLTPFLSDGLARNERVVYLADAHAPEQVLGYLYDAGVDAEAALAEDRLVILAANETYRPDGGFDPRRMIEVLTRESEAAVTRGFSALRATGEMTWSLRPGEGSERLLEYESLLNEFFPDHPCLAICQYDRRRFDATLLLDVIRTHPLVAIGATVCDNPGFVPPEEFARGGDADAELERVSHMLVRRHEARAEREQIDARYRLLVEHMPLGVAVYSTPDDGHSFCFEDFSPAAEAIDGVRRGELLGRDVAEMFPGVRELGLLDVLRRVRATGAPEHHPIGWYEDDRVAGWRENDVFRLPSGEVVAVYADRTERVRVRRERDLAQARTHQLVESSFDGIVAVDPEGRITVWNPAMERLTGRLREECFGRVADELFPFLRETGVSVHIEAALAGESTTVQDRAYEGPDGSPAAFFEGHFSPLRDEAGEVTGALAVVRDVTDAAQLRNDLALHGEELQRLATHQDRVSEEIRKEVAREVHDELGQGLTALKMDLAWLRSRLPSEAGDELHKVAGAMALTGELMHSVRRISSTLRPAMLDRLGLSAAVDWQCTEFERRAGIACDTKGTEYEPLLDEDAAVAVFRCLQEALTNVARHAEASHVWVELREAARTVRLTIRDDGRGLDPRDGPQQGSFGLLGMRERARAVGGRLVVRGDQGTTISIEVPRSPEAAK